MRLDNPVAPELLAEWARGRSLSRGLPLPIVDAEMVRVDTGLPAEERRYIFSGATPAITALAMTIVRPGILIKLCAPLADLIALVPISWRGHPQSYFMICEGPIHAAPPLPAGYSLNSYYEGDVIVAEVITDGLVVARGRAVESGELFIFDQIVTDPGHRRRGLGSNVMRRLETAGNMGRRRRALTATAAGHALYTSLGWSTLSLYSTAEFGELRCAV